MSGYFPKSALEEFVEGSVDLSPEEAEVKLDEADQNAQAAESSLEQTRRLLETAATLEDLAVVATRIERATPTEIRLIDRVSDFAAAGTEIAPQNFVPSMEGYIGARIATESILDKAKTIVEIILAHLAKIWEHINDFFKLAFVIPNMMKTVKERMQILKTLAEPRKNTTSVKFEQKLTALQVNGRIPFTVPVAGGKESTLTLGTLRICLGEWDQATTYVYETYLKNAAVAGAHIANAIDGFQFDNPLKTADVLEATLKRSTPPAIPKGRAGANTKNTDGATLTHMTGPVLFGNTCLVLNSVLDTNSTPTTLEALAAYKSISLKLESVNQNAPDDSADYMTMKLMDKEEIADLLGDIHSILSSMSDFYVGTEWRAVNSVRVNLERAAKRAANNVSKTPDPNGGAVPATAAEQYYRSLLDFSLVYAGWVQSPAIDMYRKTINIARTLLTVTDAQMRAYELKS